MRKFCNGIARVDFMLYNVNIVECYSQFDVLGRIIYVKVIIFSLKCIFYGLIFVRNAKSEIK